jgi:hypothetical protein
MPLTAFRNSFDPAELELLQMTLDETCQWLTATNGVVPNDEARKTLALRIVECAKGGERDWQKLMTYALAENFERGH